MILAILWGIVLGQIAGTGLICIGEPKTTDIKIMSYSEGLKLNKELWRML